MTKLRRYEDLCTARFVRSTFCYRLPGLNHPEGRGIVIEELDQAKHGFRLVGFVLMPDGVPLPVRMGRGRISQGQRE